MQSVSSQSYDGESDPKDFFKSFHLQAAMFNWDATKQAAVLPFYLKGKAEQVYEGLDSTKKASIKDIEVALIASCKQSTPVLLDAFHSRRKRADETYSKYGRALQDLLTRAMPNLGEAEKVSLLRSQLVKFLPAQLRLMVHFNVDKKWDELLLALDQASSCVVSDVCGYDPVSGEGTNVLRSDSAELNMVSSKRSSKYFDGDCHYCKKRGHKIADCFKRARVNQRQKYQSPHARSPNYGKFSRSSENTSSGNNYNRRNDRQRSTNANTVSVNAYDSEVESNSVETKVVHLNSVSNSVHLLRRSVRVSLSSDNCKSVFKLQAIFDCGATDSFIRLSSLPVEVAERIVACKNNNDDVSLNRFRKQTFSITSATGSVTECCVVVEFKLTFGSWSGSHEFIVTDNLHGKDMLIGRDFMKLYNVLIDNGRDVITLDKPNNYRGSELESVTKISNLHRERACTVLYTTTIEANSESFVKCVVDESIGNETILFNPVQFNESGVLGAFSVNECSNQGEIYVSLINTTGKPITVTKDSKLGVANTDFSIMQNSRTVELKTVSCNVDITQSPPLIENPLSKVQFGKSLTLDQKARLNKLIESKAEAFQLSENDVGLTNLIEHEINTGAHHPIKQRPYRMPATVKDEVAKQTAEMLRNGIIEESQSPWSSPMLIIKQKTRDGQVKFRFVVDMRKLNEVTVKDAFPLPRMDQTLDALGGAAFLSVVDAARGYFQVPLKKSDREKTAFVANNKLYQFRVMTLGLANAPSTYSRLMDLVLSGLTYRYCLVYLDDTIIYSKSFDEHLQHLEEIFDRFIHAKLKLKPEKCIFAADEVPYLGFQVSIKGIRPDPSRIDAIKCMPFPKTAKEMIRFLGAVNFYREFIPHFSDIASVLYKMSQSEKKFKSKRNLKQASESFEMLKAALMSSPLLAFPDFNLPFTIPCDASIVAIGAVLGQILNKKFRPVMYGSRHLTSAESRYSTTERELLAIVWASKRFNPYIYGRHVTFVTDHQPLVTMRSLKEPMGRIGRLFYKLQDIDYDLVYQPGSSNYTADLLSRPSVQANSIELRVESCVNWSVEQSLDSDLRAVKQFLSSENISEISLSSDWKKVASKLILENDIVFYTDLQSTRIVVPKQVVPIILKVHHDISLAGHRDFEKTYNSIAPRYFWIKMHHDVKLYCSTCHLCQTKKHINCSYRAPLKPIVVSRTWELLGIDGTGPLPETILKNRYILVAVDYFSKFCVAKAVPDMTALTTAKFLFDEIICRFGMPKAVISDHGKNYKSILFAQLCKLCQIETRNSTFYHPEGNGLVERMNKTFKQILTMYVNSAHNNWDVHLQAAIAAYNTTIQDSIGCSPYEVLFGKKPSLIADVILSNPVKVDEKPLVQYLADLKNNMEEIHKSVERKVVLSQDRQKRYYDRFVSSPSVFKEGDLVRLVNERSIVGESKSFRLRSIGPFKITSKFNDVNYTIISLETNKSQVVHFNRLRPYRDRGDLFQLPVIPALNRTERQPNSVHFEKQNQLGDTFLFSQFLAAVLQPAHVVPENNLTSLETQESPEVVAVIGDNEVTGIKGSVRSVDVSEFLNGEDKRSPCPVCNKLFVRVTVHLANKKDANHVNYVLSQKREREKE